jgi:hypothetical protein
MYYCTLLLESFFFGHVFPFVFVTIVVIFGGMSREDLSSGQGSFKIPLTALPYLLLFFSYLEYRSVLTMNGNDRLGRRLPSRYCLPLRLHSRSPPMDQRGGDPPATACVHARVRAPALTMMTTLTAGATEGGMRMIAIIPPPVAHVIAIVLPPIACVRVPAPMTTTTTRADHRVRRPPPQKNA